MAVVTPSPSQPDSARPRAPRPDPAAPRRPWYRSGYPRSFTIGAAFSVAWSPCIGPILGVILTLAATSGSAAQGALLLVFYALGLGVWFLAFGAAFSWLTPQLRKIQPYMPGLLVASGALFILVGALMLLGEFGRLNAYFQSFGFIFDQTSSAEENLSTGTNGAAGPAIAFFGGIVSFLSPCVLPLVPVYLANLAGEAMQGTGDTQADRRRVFLHAVVFVVGFMLVFAFIGASAGFLGTLVQEQLDTVTRIGGVVMIVFGLQMSGLIHLPYLDRTYQLPPA
ncbi:MAG: sulfite exporter TauE/SafE family protein [Chloroflexi bacterium]|nr:sulfite exporter TauE/SafE family protein [Chloroflexota bacterium]